MLQSTDNLAEDLVAADQPGGVQLGTPGAVLHPEHYLQDGLGDGVSVIQPGGSQLGPPEAVVHT